MRTAFLILIGTALMVPMFPAAAAAGVNLSPQEAEFCDLLNDYRATKGLAPVKVSPALTDAAEWYSRDMAVKDYWNSDHTDSLGRDPWQRMADFGYAYSTPRGENIAAGSGTASGVMQQWKNSPAHNAAMIDPAFKVVGIGHAYDSGSTYRHYWTADFGGRVDSGAISCPGSGPPATPVLHVAHVGMYEGTSSSNTRMRFVVSADTATNVNMKVKFATLDGSAEAGSDFEVKWGTLTIPAGRTSVTTTVDVFADSTPEEHEFFYFVLYEPVNAELDDDFYAWGVVFNDD